MNEIIKIESKRESCVLLGDKTRHCGNIIPDNHSKVSPAGNLLIDFLQNNEYTLLNATDKVINGPFTRYDKSDPHNNSKKSALDLVIVSNDLNVCRKSGNR